MSEDQEPTPELDPDERDPEAPDADAQEQATPANPADEPEKIRINPDWLRDA